MSTMRLVQYDRYGPPDVLHQARTAVPEPGRGEVRVRVRACSVNAADVVIRAGRYRLITGRRFPMGTGMDFSGEVDVVGGPQAAEGPGAELRVGDRVWGALPGGPRPGAVGAAAEYVVVPTDALSAAPPGVDLVQAAALPGVGVTSLVALRDHARLRPGERVLVRGANGGVGSAAVQVALALGGHVTAVAGPGARDWVRALGAHEVHDRTVAPQQIGRFDVVLDAVGTQLSAYRRLLGPGGRMVTVAFGSLPAVRSILASVPAGRSRIRTFSGRVRRRDLVELAGHVERGVVAPQVDAVHPLERLADAHRAFEAGGRRGKHVIHVS